MNTDEIEMLPASPQQAEMFAFVAGLGQRIADTLYARPQSEQPAQPQALELMLDMGDCHVGSDKADRAKSHME